MTLKRKEDLSARNKARYGISFLHWVTSNLILLLFMMPNKKYAIMANNQRLLLVSLDGYRWDFRIREPTASLDRLAENGVTVDYVRNVFPTNTVPNHYSVVTGLYPENHGLIDNEIYDYKTKKVFTLASKDPFWWDGAEPIWVTNQLQGHKSAVCFWPGYDVKIRGIQPTYSTKNKGFSKPFADKSKLMPRFKRVDFVVDLLRKDKDINFAALYSEEPDWTTHGTQPDSNNERDREKFSKIMREVDKMIGYLIKKLKSAGLFNKINLIIIGDHGQTNVNYKRVIQLNKYLDVKKHVVYATGLSTTFLYTKRGHKSFVYDKLRDANRHMKVFLKENIPERFHVKRNAHTAPIMLLPDKGWLINNTINTSKYVAGKFERGEHGFSNSLRDMNPGFIAHGPAFRKGARKAFIETVDIYPLICKILGITPRRNNGKFKRVKRILRKGKI